MIFQFKTLWLQTAAEEGSSPTTGLNWANYRSCSQCEHPVWVRTSVQRPVRGRHAGCVGWQLSDAWNLCLSSQTHMLFLPFPSFRCLKAYFLCCKHPPLSLSLASNTTLNHIPGFRHSKPPSLFAYFWAICFQLQLPIYTSTWISTKYSLSLYNSLVSISSW